LAQLYATTGRTDDAKRTYSAVLAKNPTDTMALVGLADLAIAGRIWPEAIDLLNSARAAATYDPTPGSSWWPYMSSGAIEAARRR
jgi:predicted Zn-dependent protease